MGNVGAKRSKKSSKKSSRDKNSKKSVPHYPNGVSYTVTEAILKKRRKGKEYVAPKTLFLEYNYLDTIKAKSLDNNLITDTVVLGNVNSAKGCTFASKRCQDQATAFELELNNKSSTVLGIFDGHDHRVGHKVATACTVLFEDLAQGEETIVTNTGEPLAFADVQTPKRPDHKLLYTKPKQFFAESFEFIHKSVISASDFSALKGGTTATTAIIQDKKVALAWVGDSKGVFFVSTEDDFSSFIPFSATSTHNLQTRNEKKRIQKAGGVIKTGVSSENTKAPLRVFGPNNDASPGLMLSKSIGDEYAHTLGFTYKPSVNSFDFNALKTIGDMRLRTEKYNASSLSFLSLGGSKRSLSSTMSRVQKRLSLNQRLSKKTGSSSSLPTPTNKAPVHPTSGEVNSDWTKPIKHCILIIATDGLWDYLTAKDVAEHLPKLFKERTKDSTKNISLELGLLAIEKYRSSFVKPVTTDRNDDISVITNVIF